MSILVTFVRVALGLLLIAAGALKVGHAPDLASAIAGFRLPLPPEIVEPIALILPFFEVFLGAYLVAGLFTRLAAWITCAQFALYAAVIASAVIRNIPANCGCFGPNDAATADWPHVAFDAALALLALFLALRAPGALALDRRLTRS
jgi:uncharacterized membrane protein YphA (DoxX/SURF4 family)